MTTKETIAAGVVGAALVLFSIGILLIEGAQHDALRRERATLSGQVVVLGGQIDELNRKLRNLEGRLDDTEREVLVARAQKGSRERERIDVVSSPETYVRPLGVSIDHWGLLSYSYRLRSVTLENSSHFDIASVRGTIEYRSSDGMLVKSVPAQVQGGVLAGQRVTLDATSEEITGNVDEGQSRFVVTSVETSRRD